MPHSRQWLSALFGAYALLLVSWVGADSYGRVGQPFPGFIAWDNGVLVSLHRESWTGPAAALPLNGGRILGVEGEPFRDGGSLLAAVRAEPAGTIFHYEIETEDERRAYEVASMTLRPLDYVLTFGNYLGNAAVFFAIGAIALYVRPDMLAARVLALGALVIGSMLALCVDFFAGYRFVHLFQMVEAAMPASVLYFALVFPAPVRGARSPLSGIGLLTLAAVLGIANAALFYSDPFAARRVTFAVYVLTSAATFAVLARMLQQLLTARDPDDRTRAAVVFSGAMAAFLIPAVLILAFFLLGWTFSFAWITAVMFLFPLSILLAVVRYDLLASERFIRLTVGYVLATSGVVLLYSLAAIAMDAILAPLPASGPAASFVLLIVIALLFDPLRRRAQYGVDRVFFRSTTDSGQVLEQTGAELAGTVDANVVARVVAEGVERGLQTEWCELAMSDPQSRPAALEVPVVFRDDTLGSIRCGPKESGAPFSQSERDLVSGLAAQAALALHNARTIETLRETQATLVRTERLAAIGELAGSVAHGVRNPLSSIRAAAQIAREGTQESETSEILGSVLHETDRLEQRIRHLLDFSRPFDPSPREVELTSLLDSVADVLTHQALRQGVTIERHYAPGSCQLATDPDYLEEALLELAGNALRSMPDGGTLTLGLEVGDEAVISFEDTGCGIPEAVQGRIFDIFFTTRPEGTGIGLATVRKIVERLGGREDLVRSSDAGTLFQVSLPLE